MINGPFLAEMPRRVCATHNSKQVGYAVTTTMAEQRDWPLRRYAWELVQSKYIASPRLSVWSSPATLISISPWRMKTISAPGWTAVPKCGLQIPFRRNIRLAFDCLPGNQATRKKKPARRVPAFPETLHDLLSVPLLPAADPCRAGKNALAQYQKPSPRAAR